MPDKTNRQPIRGGRGDALGRLPFFAGADCASVAELASSTHWLSLAPGQLVIDFGDPTDDVFLVAEGTLRVVVRTPLGQEMVLGDLGAGEVFGEMAAIDSAPRSASVAALHATRICRLPAAVFMDFVLRSPPVARKLLRVLTARLREQDQRMMEIALLPVRHRLAADLLRLSRFRPNGTERVISPPISHHVMAARIGARRETVSLAMADLAREKLAEVSSRAIVLPRPDLLREKIDAQLRARPPAGPRSRNDRHR